ncbi:MAG: Asp23/Gls24 family envelope stress response protein [Thermotogae bacterium]|nr:Asp23/Gls24 family envelope stress response protein [Thermotogota bacterium]
MTIELPRGKLEILPQALYSIVHTALMESYGLVGTKARSFMTQIFGKEEERGIKITEADRSLVVDLYIVLEYGVRIPVAVKNIQENVYHHLKKDAGCENVEVNVHVVGLQF